jgi:predicted transposase/invertase (TIGR01784 family)
MMPQKPGADRSSKSPSSKSPIVFVEAQGYLDRKNEVYPSFFAKIFMYQAQTENSDAIEQQRVLEWIVTVFVHKFLKLSREEIKTMLGTKAELKKTRFYQEIQEEEREAGKEEVRMTTIPMLFKAGISPEEIAQQLNISLKQVKAIAKQCKVKS